MAPELSDDHVAAICRVPFDHGVQFVMAWRLGSTICVVVGQIRVAVDCGHDDAWWRNGRLDVIGLMVLA